jgi:hypothetical protein
MKTARVAPSNERSSKEARMRLRLLAGILFVGCTVNTQPAPQYGPGYQQQGYQQPPPQQPAYQPPPQQPPAPEQPPQPPPPDQTAYTPPPPPTDVPVMYDEPTYDNVNVSLGGDAVPSVDVFYDQLDPYGTWYDDPTYGYVFTPNQADYVPFTNGHWKYTDAGLLWVSADPFGWATAHYGRWVWNNRWMWVPDTTWGPAWVNWRETNGVVGWAPAGFSNDAYVPEDHWHWVSGPDLFSVDVNRRYIRDHRTYYGASVPINR